MQQSPIKETLCETVTDGPTPVMPFIFRYRVFAPPSLPIPVDTAPTAGYETPYTTNNDGKDETDYTDDSDETDDGSNPQTGVLADSGTADDEE
ncbi:MAG: hypothetical protein H0U76_23855 [Ktedonobacteraceae bacterium]|nr:hypothetical protein [Ktedonobacteraceae bacterium]